MSNLLRKINVEKEREFHLKSKDFYRPPLKQIGKSIYEIKTHYMSGDAANIIPSKCTHLTGIRDTLVKHLEEDSFLHVNNVVTGSTIERPTDQERCLQTLAVLVDSLALAIDFKISPKPRSVQCDVLLAICGQPVIVLTLVDGDKNSNAVSLYHSSVAKGVTTTLRRFMDESINIVSGVLLDQDMKMDTFKSAITRIAEDSAMSVTQSSLQTNPSKYEKIVTAFWAGVAETVSVISSDGRVDTDYLRFLTKDQCIILMENINNREVEVQFLPGTGATTLMLEVARRLAKLDKTLLVCRSKEEMERLRPAYPETIAASELNLSDVSTYTNIVDETGAVSCEVSGKLWSFAIADTEKAEPQGELEKEKANTELTISTDKGEHKQEQLLKEFKTLAVSDINFQWLLSRKISVREERVFDLRSKDFYRPPLKQIGNSINEIKTHYMSAGRINVIPAECSPRFAAIRDTLLEHLEEESFLYKNNIATGATIEHLADQEQCLPTLAVLVDSLALAIDFEISPKPGDVQCDVLLVICGQPVIVLTLVNGDKNSNAVTLYHSSVAKGVTTALRRFMDESINIVSGVLLIQEMKMDTFKSAITRITGDSAMSVTQSSLQTNPLKYEKIVTAFWASVAETGSVISSDGRVDTDHLRFLTKDQCKILMENINNREVEVQFQPGAGATTLMVEVARRLATLDDTLLVCRSTERIQKGLRIEGLTVVSAEELGRCDLSKYTNIVDETGIISGHFSGKLWKSYTETEGLQHIVKMFETENANKEKMIQLFSSGDRQDKYKHLSREIGTLKLFDISFQSLLSANHLTEGLALELLPVKHNPGDRHERPEAEDCIGHALDQLKLGIRERKDLFPLLANMTKQVKSIIRRLQAKQHYHEQGVVDNLPKVLKDLEKDFLKDDFMNGLLTFMGELTTKVQGNKADVSVDHGELSMAHETESTQSQNIQTEKNIIVQPGVKIDAQQDPESTISPHNTTKKDSLIQGEKPGETQTMAVDVGEVTYSETIAELKKRLVSLKMEAVSKRNDLRKATDHGVEWEYTMDYLAEEMSKLKIRGIVTDVIGEEEIPAITEKHMKPTAPLVGDRSTMIPEMRRSQIYHLREREYGTLKERHILDILKNVIEDDQISLTLLRNQSDGLDSFYGNPLHFVGDIDAVHGVLVQCPPMTFNRERVNEKLAVSGNGLELVNWRGGSLDHQTDRFKNYNGTSSRFPIRLPLAPSTLRVTIYWETHTRLQVKKDVSGLWLLEMAVCEMGEVDKMPLVSLQFQSSWSLIVGDCGKHPGHVCTMVWENRRQVGECQSDTMSPTPGTYVTLIYGITLDVGRGRLEFIDINRGRVLHKFDVNFRESLSQMFSVQPLPDYFHATMRLISGREVAMTGEKEQLITQA